MKIIQGTISTAIAFDGRNIYYLNNRSELIRYDSVSVTETSLEIIAYDFLLDKEQIYYIDRTDGNRVYACNLKENTVLYSLILLPST